jgi:hypothetical protein
MGICASSKRREPEQDSDENVVYVMDDQPDGVRKVASLYSRKGNKGPNQDAVILCEVSFPPCVTSHERVLQFQEELLCSRKRRFLFSSVRIAYFHLLATSMLNLLIILTTTLFVRGSAWRAACSAACSTGTAGAGSW